MLSKKWLSYFFLISTIKKLNKLHFRCSKVTLFFSEKGLLSASEAYSISAEIARNFFEFCHHDRTRGHSLKLQKNRVLTDLRRHFFSERIVNIWNSLDENVVSAPSINSLKNKLNKLYTDESFPWLRKSAWLQGPSQSPWGGPHWWVTGELNHGNVIGTMNLLVDTLTI